MAAIKYDLIISCGETLDSTVIELTWKIDGQPVDLTGYTARAQGRRSPTPDAELLFDWSTANGKLTALGANGTFFSPNVSATETTGLWSSGLAPAEIVNGRQSYLAGAWDIEITQAGKVKRMVQGRLLVIPQVTQ